MKVLRWTAGVFVVLAAVVGVLWVRNATPATPVIAEAEVANPTRPFVVKLHAQWCPICMMTKGVWSDVENAYVDRVNLVVFDFTNDATTKATRARAARLGLEKYFDDNVGWTGTIAVIDGRTKEVRAEIHGIESLETYTNAIDAAIATELHDELVAMGEDDQAARQDFTAIVQRGDTAAIQRLIDADLARTRRLQAIVAAGGWPGINTVGQDAANAAWLVLQHTPDDGWQREMLPVLEKEAEAGNVRRQDLALLTDRVLVHGGKPQRYGGSFSITEGRMVADPIEDIEHVDERRAAMDLPPMSEYVKLLTELYHLPVEWPPRSVPKGP
jgi:thiol-disulfide isomerase/thioredoxin